MFLSCQSTNHSSVFNIFLGQSCYRLFAIWKIKKKRHVTFDLFVLLFLFKRRGHKENTFGLKGSLELDSTDVGCCLSWTWKLMVIWERVSEREWRVSGISFATPTARRITSTGHVARWSIGRGKYRRQKEESLLFSKKDYTHTSKERGEQNPVTLWRDTLWGKNISTSGG